MTERAFHSWLVKTQFKISRPEKYSKTITTISNYLKNKNIGNINLFSVKTAGATPLVPSL
jgi:hypothetical protein